MKSLKKQEEPLCPDCKIGMLKPDRVQFCVDRGDKMMLIGDVPAMVCATCLHKEFDKAIADELTAKSQALFSESSGRMFGYQFSDLVRDDSARTPFKLSDRVRIKEDVDTWDLYDEKLRPGMEGTVIGKGLNPFDYVVEFVLGSRRSRFRNVLQVEIDEQDLELVPPPIVHKPVKRKTTARKV